MKDGEARDRERMRMHFLYKRFQDIGPQTGENLKVRLKGMPVALRSSGLAVVAARLAASPDSGRDRTVDAMIADLLAEWLLENTMVFAGQEKQGTTGIRALLHHCVEAGRLEYEAAQQEASRLLEQAKLLAAALWP